MNISILDFDRSYRKQSFYHRETVDWVDLTDIPNTNLFCEQETLKLISRRLKQHKTSFLSFIGNGNYHYVTSLLLSRIRRPFSLVLIDHHTDTLPSPNDTLISCGSWVLQSLQRLPMLNKVLIIGADEDGKQYIPHSISEKVNIITKHEFLPDKSYFAKNVETESVYISIDKDVLCKKEAATAWDQGIMTLKELAEILKAIFQSKKVIGVDVCGEFPVNPDNEFTKKAKQAVIKNNDANQLILDKVKLYFYSYYQKLFPVSYQKAKQFPVNYNEKTTLL